MAIAHAPDGGAPATPRESDLPVWGGPADLLRFFLGWAVLAPSRHNAQPWVFEVEGDEARVYADPWRALPAVDPRDRELEMACGAALLNLRLAAAHFGWATSHEVVAGGRRDGMLARLRLEERRPPGPDEEELFRAIPCRRTCRLPLEGRDPPGGLVARLSRDAAEEGAVLRPVEDAERAAIAELVAEGDRTQWADGRVRAEYARWTRTGGSSRRDGMPAWSLGLSDAAAFLQPIWLRVSDPGAVEAERDRRRVAAARVLLCLGSWGDHPADHVVAGQALQRVLLRAAGAGLAACYLGSPVEVPELARRLRDTLGMRAFPQVLFRVGYGGTMRPTPRRPVDDVVRRMEPLPPPPAMIAVSGGRAPAGAGEARSR
jgi:nitroreductase